MTSYVNSEGRLQKRHYIRNVAQPTGSLYDFRFKSYGPLCDFYKSGDLDLDFYPIFTKKNCQGPWNWVNQLSNFQKDRTSGVACTSCNYGQTNRQTDKWKGTLRVHTLQNWTYRLSDLPCRLQWQRSRTQTIGPNDSNEECAMSRVLFGINIAAIQKIRDLDLLHLTLTFFLDLWPWYLTLRLIYYYLDALKKTLQKCIVLTSRDAKTAPHMLEQRPTYRLVFCQ